eukprot:scaffold5332_cov403-Prasinococcus_capsulatus_cf.AAC.2
MAAKRPTEPAPLFVLQSRGTLDFWKSWRRVRKAWATGRLRCDGLHAVRCLTRPRLCSTVSYGMENGEDIMMRSWSGTIIGPMNVW